MSNQEQQTKPDGGASVSTAMLGVERCDLCRFWNGFSAQIDGVHPDDMLGTCRRYPPILDMTEAKEFCKENYSYLDYRFWNQPVTEAQAWCGEFKTPNA